MDENERTATAVFQGTCWYPSAHYRGPSFPVLGPQQTRQVRPGVEARNCPMMGLSGGFSEGFGVGR